MKTTRKTWTAAWVAGAALSLWSLQSSAATLNCPTSLGGDIKTYVQLTFDGAAGTVACWDYGSPNVNGVINIQYGTDPAQPNDDQLELPMTQANTIDLSATLTGDTDSGTSGNLIFTYASTSAMYLVFKTGGGQNYPWWMAFKLLPGFDSNFTVGWNILCSGCTGPINGLSGTRLYTTEGDEYLVPIPAAAWLFGSGLLGLLAVGRRRKTGVVAA